MDDSILEEMSRKLRKKMWNIQVWDEKVVPLWIESEGYAL